MTASVKQALMGRSELIISRALRQANLDVLFLFHLHQSCNCRIAEKDRYFAIYSLMLAQQLNALKRENVHSDQAQWNRIMVGLRTPNPLDAETAAAVDAAIQHHLIPWEVLEESDELNGWVIDSFLAEGRTELPDGAYRLQHEYSGSFPPLDPEPIQAQFPDQESFDKFLAGEDFSYGLADVTDAEYTEHHETIGLAMKGLGLDGLMVELPTVPHAFLREAPLIEGQWLDRYVVMLAEWGARLAQQGLVVEESDDPHPLAWFRIADPEEGTEAGRDLTNKLWQQTRKHLDRFPGRTQETDGRKYLNWEDYLGWRGRRVKGNIASGLSPGLVMSRWNRWAEEQSGEGKMILARTLVGRRHRCEAQVE